MNHAALLKNLLNDYLPLREVSVGGSVTVFKGVLADRARPYKRLYE